eukprot:1612888-Alexandrium_andersonii.AAC.1
MADTPRSDGRPIHRGTSEPSAQHRLEASAPSRSSGTSKDRSFRAPGALKGATPFLSRRLDDLESRRGPKWDEAW